MSVGRPWLWLRLAALIVILNGTFPIFWILAHLAQDREPS